MHFLGLQDRLPLFGLAVALMVIFQRPIRNLLEVIHEFEVINGLALLPGLVILLTVLVLHYQSNRERQRVKGVATAARAEFNRERAVELARIVNFGQASTKLRDIEGLREIIRQHLPQFVGDRQVWALLRTGGKWQSLMGKDWTSQRPSPALEALSDQVLELDTNGHGVSEGTEREGYVCFPLIVTDGFDYYEKVVRRLFGIVCLYGQVIKTRRNDRVIRVTRKQLIGAPWRFDNALIESEDSATLNTSFIERLNLTIRQGTAYLTRRSACHARSRERLEGQLEILRFHYNFARPHRALKFGTETRTPAMQAGLTTRRLSFRDVFSSPIARLSSGSAARVLAPRQVVRYVAFDGCQIVHSMAA